MAAGLLWSPTRAAVTLSLFQENNLSKSVPHTTGLTVEQEQLTTLSGLQKKC